MPPNFQERLEIRPATIDDIAGISDVIRHSYGSTYTADMLRGQITNFPEGHMVAVLGDTIIGYCATLVIEESKVMAKHTWREITGGGFGTTHNPQGEYLYGYEVCVHADYRKYSIGQRFYQARRRLCEQLNKKGIVFCGRLPNLAKKIKSVKDPNDYVRRVINREIRDPVVRFHLRQGFSYLGIMENYLPWDADSLGVGAQYVWNNPKYSDSSSAKNAQGGRSQENVRIASVQYQQRRIANFDEFVRCVEYFVDVCADYNSDFVVFPEFFTLQLLSIKNEQMPPHESIKAMCDYEEQIIDMFQRLAIKYNINIIGGSTPSLRGEEVRNTSHVFLRDGSMYQQDKIHPTPNEKYWWNVKGGDKVSVINTDAGPIGVLICYDSEFPELCRHLVNQGALLLFVPFLTDERQSYCRVRYSCQARAVENQIYVVMSGSCGNLPNVHNIDIHYSQSCILTPCDFPFARDGVAADTTPNVEAVVFADVNLQALLTARVSGTVRNLQDRRHDLYEVKWLGP